MTRCGCLLARLQAFRTVRPGSAVKTIHAQSACTSCTGSHRSLAHSAPARRAVPFSLNSFNKAQDDRDERVVRMLMFGKPGAGKGTLSARLVKKYDILSISTGDLLRQHIAEGTQVGKEAEKIMAQGALLPDEVVLKVITTSLDGLQNKHWILDGFPRTLGQGKLLDAHLKKQNTPLSLVVNLDVPDEVILRRISDRWMHLPSGRVYNTSYNAPRVLGYDDVTGEPLTRRPDDNPEIFAHRLESFYASTSSLLSFYVTAASTPLASPSNPYQHPHQLSIHRPAKLAVRSVAGRTSDEIWPELDYIIRSMFPGLRERSETRTNRRANSLNNVIAADRLEAAASFK